MTKVDCITEYGEEQYDKGMEKGMEKGQIQIIENYLNRNMITLQTAVEDLLSLNCETKTITKITGLNEKEIKSYIQ